MPSGVLRVTRSSLVLLAWHAVRPSESSSESPRLYGRTICERVWAAEAIADRVELQLMRYGSMSDDP